MEEIYAKFKQQSELHLDQIERERIKAALAAFLKSQDLETLVETLVTVLDTDAKAQMLPTLCKFIPARFEEGFVALVTLHRGGMPDEEAEGDADPFAGLSDAEIQMRIMDNPDLVSGLIDGDEDAHEGDDGAGEVVQQEHPFKGLSQLEIQQRIMDDPSLAEYGLPPEEDKEELSMFDLVISMAEADMSGDIAEDQSKNVEEVQVRERLQSRGFRSAEFMRNKQRSTSTSSSTNEDGARAPRRRSSNSASSITGSDSGDSHVPLHRRPSAVKKILPDYLCECKSRSAAKAFLQMGNPEPGLFLIREKDPQDPSGSIRRKPGQKPPYKVWALSYVDKDGEIRNALMQLPARDAVMQFAGKDLHGVFKPHDAVLRIAAMKEFSFKTTPFQCRRWYHGPISRDEAASRLSGSPDGTFLVRKSTKEKDMYVISVFAQEKTYHNKVKYEEGKWVAAASPQYLHKTLVDLVQHHKSKSFGLTALHSPCPRPEPFTLDEPEQRQQEEEEDC